MMAMKYDIWRRWNYRTCKIRRTVLHARSMCGFETNTM